VYNDLIKEVDPCIRCGNCFMICPVVDLLPPSLKALNLLPLNLSRNIDFIKLSPDLPYYCTQCGECVLYCPLSIMTPRVFLLLREFSKGQALPSKIRDAILNTGNIYGMPNEMRVDWVTYAGLSGKVPVGVKADVAYFLGCMTSFRARLQKVAKACAILLNKVGESWTILGPEEHCCGLPLLFAGYVDEFKEIANRNVGALEHLGIEEVVFTCAGCYRVFKYEYERRGVKPPFKALHVIEYIADLMKEGKLRLRRGKSKLNITWHDPCELSRYCGLVDEPRFILKALTDNLVEMSDSREWSKCCGGGGLLRAVHTELSSSMAKRRVEQALEVHADIIATACPSCILTLEEGAKGIIKVKDIVELVAEAF